MSRYNKKHDKLYPCGKKDVMCESLGHDWKYIQYIRWFQKKYIRWSKENIGKAFNFEFRECLRCERLERSTIIDGKRFWELASIEYDTSD